MQKELRVKESDRIKAVVDNLALCGVDFTEFEDGYEIRGGELKKCNYRLLWRSQNCHEFCNSWIKL